MDIKEKFIELTTRTYPHGTEQELFHLLPDNLETDEFGNKFIIVGEDPTTLFTCHLDTASSTVTNVIHKFDGDFIKTSGSSILGADDKAGCVILLKMIERGIKGIYYFFLGEERGCVGSRKLANKHRSNPIPNIQKVVSFDRRGTDSVITHQLGGRCCSEEFGEALAHQLNINGKNFKYMTDPTGIYTDSAQFTEIYSECTNISVGYYDEHSHHEKQNIDHLERLSEAVLKVSWEELPIKRDPKSNDYDDYEDYPYYGGSYYTKKQSVSETKSYQSAFESNPYQRKTVFFIDPIYNYRSSVTFNGYSNKITEMELSPDRLQLEEDRIKDLFTSFEIDYQSFRWDGALLHIVYNETHTSTMYRQELSEYIGSLDFWKSECDYDDF